MRKLSLKAMQQIRSLLRFSEKWATTLSFSGLYFDAVVR